jgi:hypothetical protein
VGQPQCAPVLITSQNPNWPNQPPQVPILDPDAAADFSVNRTGNRQEVRDLADMLDGLPAPGQDQRPEFVPGDHDVTRRQRACPGAC